MGPGAGRGVDDLQAHRHHLQTHFGQTKTRDGGDNCSRPHQVTWLSGEYPGQINTSLICINFLTVINISKRTFLQYHESA